MEIHTYSKGYDSYDAFTLNITSGYSMGSEGSYKAEIKTQGYDKEGAVEKALVCINKLQECLKEDKEKLQIL
jgi:hypothetical protein